MTLYQITDEAVKINELFENAVDENGEPRELTQEEKDTLGKWILENEETFSEKFDSYGKVIENLKLQADLAKATKDSFKAELDRLAQREKTAKNRAETLKNTLLWAMQTMKIDKVKTALFSASIRENPLSIDDSDIHIEEIPEEYLKKELVKSSVTADIKSGKLQVTESGLIHKNGELLGGLKALRKKSLSIK